MRRIKFRIAPTPSGFLHLGNVYNFLLTQALSQQLGGNLLLRIDDLDRQRFRKTYLDHIFETLAWLDLPWQEGPKNPDDFTANFSQQLRLPQYDTILKKLVEKQAVYACTCSRTQLEHSPNRLYDGTCRNKSIALDTPNAAWRLHVPNDTTITFNDAFMGRQQIHLQNATGDFVVRKKDGLPAYQVTSVSDDLAYNISHIVRGVDLLSSTAAQLFMAERLDLTEFKTIQFYHHPLITDELGNKISKSTGSITQSPFDFTDTPMGVKQAFSRWQFEKGLSAE